MKRNTKEWKEKRAEFLKGKTCEWCGSFDSLCIHIPRAYSPAQVSSEIYSAAYTRFREVYRQKYQKFDFIPTGKHRHKSHPSWHKASTVHKIEPDHTDLEGQLVEIFLKDSEEGNFKKLYHEWLEENRIKELIEEETNKAEEECDSLTNAIVLCKRCNFASLRDMNLCPKCRNRYKSVNYETCFDCLPDKRKTELRERQK
jgi:hypothetical protein